MNKALHRNGTGNPYLSIVYNVRIQMYLEANIQILVICRLTLIPMGAFTDP